MKPTTKETTSPSLEEQIAMGVSSFIQTHLPWTEFVSFKSIERIIISIDGTIHKINFFEGTHKDLNVEGERGYEIIFTDTSWQTKSLLFFQKQNEYINSDIADFIVCPENLKEVLNEEWLKSLQTLIKTIGENEKTPKSADKAWKLFEGRVTEIIAAE